MVIESVMCDKCYRIFKKDDETVFSIQGNFTKGNKALTFDSEKNYHFCVNCFIQMCGYDVLKIKKIYDSQIEELLS